MGKGNGKGLSAEGPLSRRNFLAGMAGTAAIAATQSGCGGSGGNYFEIAARSAASTLQPPPSFPWSIPLYQQAYQNWSGQISIAAVWTCAPTSDADVVLLANWAKANGYKLRAAGARHGWSPLTVVQGAPVDQVILLDTTKHFTSITINGGSPATFTAGAGATMDSILAALEAAGLGLVSVPAPGVITIAGALAVAAHGGCTSADNEVRIPGTGYGSLSNLVTSLTAVVWDTAASQYVLKTFNRADPLLQPLLTHLGRTFITSVTLQAGSNYRLRCQSFIDIPATTLFGAPGTRGRTFSSYIAASGRAEAIWFPFTANPWLKVWTVSPSWPWFSRVVTSPYNYSFSDSVDQRTADFIAQISLGNVAATPAFGNLQAGIVTAGLIATGSWDLWGWSKNTLLYIRPTTLRMSEGGGAVITKRANIQQVVYDFASWYTQRIAAYQAEGRFPINGPVEIRCSGLDQPGDVLVPSAGSPTLSALRPRPDHPEWDTAVWLNVLGLPGTPDMFLFYREMEQWMMQHFTGSYGAFRPEWSKGWGFSTTAPYEDADVISNYLPNAYRAGQAFLDNWDSARFFFNSFDPARVFSNSFLDQLLP